MSAQAPGFAIQVQLPAELVDGVDFIDVRQAVRWVGEHLQLAWLKLASGELVNKLTGNYADHIDPRSPKSSGALRYPYDGDDFAVAIFNNARHAAAIEYGFAAFNLADRIEWGKGKTRRGKNGRWYLRIPFSHSSPMEPGQGRSVGSIKASLPSDVYEIAKKMRKGERLTLDQERLRENISTLRRGRGGPVIGQRGTGAGGGQYVTPTSPATRAKMTATSHSVPVGNGQHVTRYPGRERSPASFAAAQEHAAKQRAEGHDAPEPSPHRATASIYEGLFRSGAKGHGQYTTIRVITPDSQWWIPGRPGLHVAQRVAEESAPRIKEAIEAAFRRDVERAMAQALNGLGGGG